MEGRGLKSKDTASYVSAITRETTHNCEQHIIRESPTDKGTMNKIGIETGSKRVATTTTYNVNWAPVTSSNSNTVASSA